MPTLLKSAWSCLMRHRCRRWQVGLFEAQIVILRWFDHSLMVAQKGPLCILRHLPLYVPLSPSVCLSVYLPLYSLLSLSLPCLLSLLSLLHSLCLMQGSRLQSTHSLVIDMFCRGINMLQVHGHSNQTCCTWVTKDWFKKSFPSPSPNICK